MSCQYNIQEDKKKTSLETYHLSIVDTALPLERKPNKIS
jgi:hypothetical protein